MRNVRYAARVLLARPGFSTVAILTLALGIGATTTMFAVVYAALWRPVPFADPDSLAILYVTRTTPRDGFARLRWSRPVIEELTGTASFEAVASFTRPTVAIAGGAGAPEQIDAEIVSPPYFRILRAAPSVGRTFLDDEDRAPGAHPVVVISDRLWRRRFDADPSLVGGSIRVNDIPLTVVGIMPAGFFGLSGKADAWIPPAMAPILTYADYLTTPQHFISVVARLRAGIGVARANAELEARRDRFVDPAGPPDAQWSAIAVPASEARVDPTVRRSALMLLGAAACVLLIACVNVAALMLARGRARRREIAIRLAIGSGRRHVIRQLLAEAALLAAVAGVAGVLLAAWSIDLLARALPATVATFVNDYGAIASFASPRLDLRSLAFGVAITGATTVTFQHSGIRSLEFT